MRLENKVAGREVTSKGGSGDDMAQMIIYAAARRAAVASVPPSVRDLVTVCAESHRVRSRLAR
jgi:hypothetical protein